MSFSGEGGIRTREPLWVTRFPSVRAKPDYATSPSIKRRDYTREKSLAKVSNDNRCKALMFSSAELVVVSTFVDPSLDQLHLIGCQFGSTLGHPALGHQLDKQAVGPITRNDHSTVLGTGQQGGMTGE